MIDGCKFVHECSRGVRLNVMAGAGYLGVGDMVAGVSDGGVYERYRVVRLSNDWNFIVVRKVS